MDLKKKLALVAAGSIVSAGALFAVVNSANASDTTTAPAVTSPTADAGYTDANEGHDPADANEANDPADANEANDPADANEANDPADANEGYDPVDANEEHDGPESSGK